MTDRSGCEGCSAKCASSLIPFLICLICIGFIISGSYVPAIIVGVIGLSFWLLLSVVKRVKKRKLTFTSSAEPEPEPLHTISSRTPAPFTPPQHWHPSPAAPPSTPPMGHRSSFDTPSQISHAFHTQSSTFASSPYIVPQMVAAQQHPSAPSAPPAPAAWPPATAASLSLDLSQPLAWQAGNQSPPAYPEVMNSDAAPPPLISTSAVPSGAHGEMFGPSADGLPSYEAVVATRQPRQDAPPAYSPS